MSTYAREICKRLSIPIVESMMYQSNSNCRAVRIVNSDTNDTIEFRSVYNLAKSIGSNTGLLYNRLRGGKTFSVTSPRTVWRTDTTIEVGVYTVEFV